MAGSPTCVTLMYILWQLTEHLSRPKVTMGLQSNKNGTCVTNLTCYMEHGGEDVIYTWKALGQAASETHNGSILPISWRWGESDMTFICFARNPISSNSSSPILARKLCEENDPNGRSSKYTLFHSGNTKKDRKSPLTAHDARHTKAIYL
uniref:SLAM family member 7 n=1 Tax=Saimiri boliviensis boliviensis TaxID=39432 RepID=A0A2K6TB28_SAIBB